MHEQLSLTERRSVAGLTLVLYLTLTGYKAAAPQFSVSTPYLKLINLQSLGKMKNFWPVNSSWISQSCIQK